MHDFSPAKLPMLEASEILYLEAIAAATSFTLAASSVSVLHDHRDAEPPASLTPKRSSNIVNTTEHSLSVYSSHSSQDLESHASFDNIQTPTRILAQSVSTQDMRLPPPQMQRLTPLASPQIKAWRPNFALKGFGPGRLTIPNDLKEPFAPIPAPRTSSFMNLAPIGNTDQSSPFDDSPKKTSHIPPRPLPPTPRTVSTNHLSSAMATQHPQAFPPSSSPSLDHALQVHTPQQTSLTRSTSLPNTHEPASNITMTLTALTTQLHTHLLHLRTTKRLTLAAHAERTAKRAQIQAGVEQSKGNGSKLTQTRSFWSFTDPSANEVEKNKKIERGRVMGWKRDRFEAERYERLAELALGELGEEE